MIYPERLASYIPIFTITACAISCHNETITPDTVIGRQEEKVGIIKDSLNQHEEPPILPHNPIVYDLLKIGIDVLPSVYDLRFEILLKYNEREIPVEVFASMYDDGYVKIEKIILDHNGKKEIQVKNFETNASNISYIKNNKFHQFFSLRDFNFDNIPELLIYNSASGNKNVLHDIYTIDEKNNRLVFDNFLSSLCNPYIDSSSQELRVFSEGGMASKIYGSEAYTWKDHQWNLIRTIRQDYDHDLKMFIRSIKEKKNSDWDRTIDTLSAEEADAIGY